MTMKWVLALHTYLIVLNIIALRMMAIGFIEAIFISDECGRQGFA